MHLLLPFCSIISGYKCIQESTEVKEIFEPSHGETNNVRKRIGPTQTEL